MVNSKKFKFSFQTITFESIKSLNLILIILSLTTMLFSEASYSMTCKKALNANTLERFSKSVLETTDLLKTSFRDEFNILNADQVTALTRQEDLSALSKLTLKIFLETSPDDPDLVLINSPNGLIIWNKDKFQDWKTFRDWLAKVDALKASQKVMDITLGKTTPNFLAQWMIDGIRLNFQARLEAVEEAHITRARALGTIPAGEQLVPDSLAELGFGSNLIFENGPDGNSKFVDTQIPLKDLRTGEIIEDGTADEVLAETLANQAMYEHLNDLVRGGSFPYLNFGDFDWNYSAQELRPRPNSLSPENPLWTLLSWLRLPIVSQQMKSLTETQSDISVKGDWVNNNTFIQWATVYSFFPEIASLEEAAFDLIDSTSPISYFRGPSIRSKEKTLVEKNSQVFQISAVVSRSFGQDNIELTSLGFAVKDKEKQKRIRQDELTIIRTAFLNKWSSFLRGLNINPEWITIEQTMFADLDSERAMDNVVFYSVESDTYDERELLKIFSAFFSQLD